MIRYITCLTTRQVRIFKPRLCMAEIAVAETGQPPITVLALDNAIALPVDASGSLHETSIRDIIEFLRHIEQVKRIDTLLVHDRTAGPLPAAITRYAAERYRVRLRNPAHRFDGALYTRLCMHGPYRHNSGVLLPHARLPVAGTGTGPQEEYASA